MSSNQETKPLCQAPACGKPAKMQCPACIKLYLPASHFCSQTCFRQSWGIHRLCHRSAADAEASKEQVSSFDPYPEAMYTGPLRAEYPLSPTRAVPSTIKRPDYAIDGQARSEQAVRNSSQITVLKPNEIEAMRNVSRLAREVLDAGARAIKAGVTTDEIDRVIHEAIVERGAYPSPLNYYNFPKSCCTSLNEVICHGIPDRRQLQDGDIINIDVSIYKDGFHSDLNETYFVGNVDETSRKLVQTTYDCLDLAIKQCKPGMLYRDLGRIIEEHANANGFSVVRNFTGHGVGRLFHTAPTVFHFAGNKAVGVMKPGHTFTIEPMINVGVHQDARWSDGWTIVTADGKRTAQFEHTLLVTETGCEILTARLPDSPGFNV
ncbi:methionyl aminopeptidase 1 [Ramicandelaber brevisporus]|nr:methionyl aminopeptidase 1 [Ramicandelaber brevisporus]